MSHKITYPVYDPHVVWGMTGRVLPKPGNRAWCYRAAGRVFGNWRWYHKGTEPECGWVTRLFRAIEVTEL